MSVGLGMIQVVNVEDLKRWRVEARAAVSRADEQLALWAEDPDPDGAVQVAVEFERLWPRRVLALLDEVVRLRDLWARRAAVRRETLADAIEAVVSESGAGTLDELRAAVREDLPTGAWGDSGTAVGGGDWADDFGTGVRRPDLEGLDARRGEATAEQVHEVIWWAFALENRVHELELALNDRGPTAGEILEAARAGDEDAQRAVDEARAEGERRRAERVEELRRRFE